VSGAEGAVEAMPLYVRIRSDLEDRIRSGAWPPGHRIPFEHELTAQYGCARMTVNKAVASLAESGLIVRRRGAGSVVAEPRVESAILNIPDIRADILARGKSYGLQLLSRRARLPSVRRKDEVELAAGGSLLALRCLHIANGQPFALERRLISLAAVPEAADIDFAVQSPGTWLLEHVPWTKVEHRISAVNADGRSAKALALAEGDACLVIDRRTWRGDERITHVEQTFPGEAFDLVARIARPWDGR